MTIFEKVKNRILNFLGVKKLSQNPNDDRFTYLSDEDIINKAKIKENKIWYYGDSNELLNYYTSQETYGNNEEPIYNRNRNKYFWAIATRENLKRVHSGIPNAIITTMVNVIGTPEVKNENANVQSIIDKIYEENNLVTLINQQQMPLTMACGYGAFKPVIDKDLSDYPLIEFYDAEDVEFIKNKGKLIGIIYKDYYVYNKKQYLFLETRRTANGNSYIEYELFELGKNNELKKVELNTIPYFEGLSPYGLEIKGLKMPLGVESIFFEDVMNKGYGKSIYSGKIDLFDDLDQSLSQRSKTCRVSTPVEYYPVDLLERTKDGKPKMPNRYDRDYVELETAPNGDGESNGEIKTSQPVLNFEQYNQEQISILGMILNGILSPATMGIDIAKKDNADAQREKEKVTIMTRNNIIDRQTSIIKKLMNICLMLKEYMDTGVVTINDYDISVKFCEFANPSFENLANVLQPLWSSGAMSTEMFVDRLYGDSLSEEEKQKEIAKINENRQRDDLSLGDFDNEASIGTSVQEETINANAINDFTE